MMSRHGASPIRACLGARSVVQPRDEAKARKRRTQMPIYKAPVEDTLFLLNDVFNIERYNNLPGFSDATPDVVEAVLGEGAKLCEEVLAAAQPLGRSRRLQAQSRWHGDDAEGLQASL